MFNIAVLGTGYVGLVAGACFAHVGHKVVCVDVDEEKIKLLSDGVCPVFEPQLPEIIEKTMREGRLRFTTSYEYAFKNADAIFIGVGTPERQDGSADLRYIDSAIGGIARALNHDCLIVVKSTVPIGTNDYVERLLREAASGKGIHLEVASNPEFLSQGSAVHDTLCARRIIIGAESDSAREKLKKIYEPFGLPTVCVSRRSAEMIKYASNDFLALKISYMNDIANLCELVGADVEDVALGMSYDERIGSQFLRAGIGFGGSCFPKDTKALAHIAMKNGYELKTVKAAIEVNEAQKTKLYRMAMERLGTLSGRRAALLGVTFKPNTDDLREAPSLVMARLLIDVGAEVSAYDPIGGKKFGKCFPAVSVKESAAEALQGADVCFILTEWHEFEALTPETFKKNMTYPLVYDGRNVLSPERMREGGVEYYSIGR